MFHTDKDGNIELFVDYNGFNHVTAADTYSLPCRDDCIDRLGDAAVFNTLDDNCGYYKILNREEVRNKTRFTTHIGTYRYS